MEKEIELKLQVAPENIAILRNHPNFVGSFRDSTKQVLNSIYFDSPDQFLRENGLTLRVREIGSQHIQTIKSVNQGSDWLERSEWEQVITGDQPDLTHVTDAALGRILTEDVRNALQPIFQTKIERTTCRVSANASDIIVAVDEGQIVAKDSSCPLAEIELELKRGNTTRLFEIARAINNIVPAQLYVKSKSERGYDLVEKRPPTSEKACNPEIMSGTPAGQAFTMIGRACLRHLVANTTATINRDVEALHQMRVALRRLRACISLFSDFLEDDKIEAIKTELKWLAREFAPARNVDTLIIEAIRPLRQKYRKEPGLVSIGKMFARQRVQCYRRVREVVQSPRFRKLVLDTAEWIEVGPWSTLPLSRTRRETPIEMYAEERISRHYKKVRRGGAKMADLNSEQLHRLRIQVKKLRYGIEFFSKLYNEQKSIKRQKKVLSSLAQLQTALGRINDVVTHKALFANVIANPRRGLTGLQNHHRAYAVGLIIGDQQAQIRGLLDRARKAYSRFDEGKQFWVLSNQRSRFSGQ
jgi:triphosphatase